MSRHTFQHGDDTWTVGYDRPLRTFYAQVEPRTDLLEHHATRTAFLQRHQPAVHTTPTSYCSPSPATPPQSSRPSST